MANKSSSTSSPTPTLPPFAETTKCKMCAYPNIALLFCEKEHMVGDAGLSSMGTVAFKQAVPALSPHFHRQCNRCGYAWLEGPVLATTSPEPEV